MKNTNKNDFNATIGNTVLSAVAFILFSCKEPIKVKPDRNLDFIVTEKVSLKNELRRGGDTDNSGAEKGLISMKRYGLPEPNGGLE